MATDLHIPRIETYEYMGFMLRVGITHTCVLWRIQVGDKTISGSNTTVAAAKSRAKQEVQRAIERYEREGASNRANQPTNNGHAH